MINHSTPITILQLQVYDSTMYYFSIFHLLIYFYLFVFINLFCVRWKCNQRFWLAKAKGLQNIQNLSDIDGSLKKQDKWSNNYGTINNGVSDKWLEIENECKDKTKFWR